MRCWSGWLRGDAMDQQDRAQRAMARAAAIIAVSRRLLDQVSEEMEARSRRTAGDA